WNCLPVQREIKKNRGVWKIRIPFIMANSLVIPRERARLRVQGHHRRDPQICPRRAPRVWRRVARPVVEKAQLLVDGEAPPVVSAARRSLGGVAPGVDERNLCRIRRIPETPYERPGLRIERIHVATNRRRATTPASVENQAVSSIVVDHRRWG